jgi:hypothetical protein
MSRNGDFYWVFAHVTPSFDAKGNVIGFHSSRRVSDSNVLTKTIIPLYADILREEKRHQNWQQELAAASISSSISRSRGTRPMTRLSFRFKAPRAGNRRDRQDAGTAGRRRGRTHRHLQNRRGRTAASDGCRPSRGCIENAPLPRGNNQRCDKT